MPVEVILPKVDMDMESAIIETWLVRDGDRVEAGDALFEIVTNKAAMEVEAPASGVISAISGRIGEAIPVGAVVAMIFRDGEPITGAPVQARPPAGSGGEDLVRATPLARKTARELGLALADIAGTGPRGRISEKDVRGKTALAKPAAKTGRLVPLGAVRRIAAARLVESARQAPHFYMTAEIDMTALQARLGRARAAAAARSLAKPSLTLLIAQIVARVLRAHPYLAASLEEDAVRLHERTDIAIAVERDGELLAPVLRDVADRPIEELAADFARLKSAVLDRSVRPADLTGGVFTISNLGMYGVDAFTAIINPPQSAILAIGRALDRPVAREGRIVLAPVAVFSLSSDHRIVDGVAAARFMADLRGAIEAPAPG